MKCREWKPYGKLNTDFHSYYVWRKKTNSGYTYAAEDTPDKIPQWGGFTNDLDAAVRANPKWDFIKKNGSK